MFPPSLLAFVFAACLANLSLGATISQASQLTTKTYDYIIVGAGTAGLTIANRLTENPAVTVLVLEAGISDEGQAAVTAPFLAPTITPNSPIDWNYTVTPQAALNGRSFPYPRGRLLGGSSSVNYCFHQYGSTEDWDRFARVSGDPGWAWSNIRQYVKKHETVVPPADGHNTAGQILPALHGTSGNVHISVPGFNQSSDSRVLATTRQLAEFPYNPDMSGIDRPLLGTGFVQSSIGGGVRSSSSTAYLAPANSRPNLTVLINASVQKLVQTGTVSGVKAFRGVQFTSSPGTAVAPGGSASIQVTARKEVILSAGTIGTVQILQLSGIGNPADLNPFKIPVLVNHPMVGRNFMDHTFLPVIFNVKGQQTVDHVLQDPNQLNAVVNQFFTNHTGMLADNVSNNLGFARIPANSSIFKTHPDPTPGPNTPHYEFIPTNFHISPTQPEPATGSFFTIVTALLNPTSRGSIKIRSANSFDAPLIDPALLTTDIDLFIKRESVKAVYRFLSAPAWDGFIGSPLVPVSTDNEIDAFIRNFTTTIFHPVGTAAMTTSKANVNTGVLNPDLTVKNTVGLRVVDASAFPFVPSSHTQGPVYMLAERASDLIKKA